MKQYEDLIEVFQSYLLEQQKICKSTMKYYMEQGSQDSANLEKVKENVICIFAQMFEISCKQTQSRNEVEALVQAYLPFFERIPAEWYIKKAKAEAFGDDENRIIEEIKIEMMEKVKETFWGYVKEL